MRIKIGCLVVGLVVLTGCGPVNPGEDLINSFEACVAAGNPVMESYPAQCMTPGGKSFVQQISEVEKRRLTPSTGESGRENEAVCEDVCGDGMCQEVVCLGTGCPCAETGLTCSEDCGEI